MTSPAIIRRFGESLKIKAKMFHNFRINRIEENSNFSELTFAKYVEMSLHILHCYLLLGHFMLQTVWNRNEEYSNFSENDVGFYEIC